MGDDRCDLLGADVERSAAVRAGSLEEEPARRAAQRGAASSGPSRLRCDLAWITGRSDTLVSHDVRVLRETGPTASRRAGRIAFSRLAGAESSLLDAATAPQRSAAR
jgi:hypothetical protein